jgi:cell division transport system ATP-binding protein
LIYFDNVDKIYSNQSIGLYHLTTCIEFGEFVFIVGASGSGKSSFIKLLLKETEVTSGKIIVNRQCLSRINNRLLPFYRRNISVVFQDFRLLPNKTVYDNVAFAMRVVNASRKEIQKNVPIVLSMVGLSEKARCFPKELSGGEKQRTAIARAIINKPPVLLADEPTGNLDQDNALEIMELLHEINMKNTTVIVATHAQNLVDRMKKRVITLDNGSLVKDTKG